MAQQTIPPHVLIFPFPVQGHVTTMLKLSELFCLAGIHVTYLISTQNYTRLVRCTNVLSRLSPYPGFRFQVLPESVSDGNAQSMDLVMNLFESLKTAKTFFKDLLIGEAQKPVTCIISDGLMSFTLDLGEEIGIPIIYFRTISSCSFWAYFCMPKLVEAGELPLKGDDMDVLIKNVPGMECFLRQRDLPSLCRVSDLNNSTFTMISSETHQTVRARALILNTFEDLEGPILSQIRTEFPNTYTIGPLHAHLKARLDGKTASQLASSNSLWEEDKSCIKWLDNQPLKSVVYVSFGSIAMVTREQLVEFWHGLVNSGIRFLWVIRPDSVTDEEMGSEIQAELEKATKARGYMVEWAPQEAVLAHQAVGGFLTHSGWNSTLESIFEGVPMICWPYFADQQINSRFVGEVWKVGLDIKDTCDRVVIEKAVKDMMEVRKEEFVESADQIAKMARKSVGEGGSSYCNLNRLIEDIMLMTVGGITP
uniref:Glycosyltransferase n=1 Tax=Panax ginseng TaxID=4054 RepID=A0A0D5ZD70_PANGI|nr:UGTPg25 [Panax ginseng]